MVRWERKIQEFIDKAMFVEARDLIVALLSSEAEMTNEVRSSMLNELCNIEIDLGIQAQSSQETRAHFSAATSAALERLAINRVDLAAASQLLKISLLSENQNQVRLAIVETEHLEAEALAADDDYFINNFRAKLSLAHLVVGNAQRAEALFLKIPSGGGHKAQVWFRLLLPFGAVPTPTMVTHSE